MQKPTAVRKEATVVSSDKYNQSANYIFQDFCNDVVFKLANGSKVNTVITNVNLPIYVGQQVQLIWIDEVLMAYEDKDTGDWYYFTSNPATAFHHPNINWRTVIIATPLIWLLLSMVVPPPYHQYVPFALLLPFGFRFFRLISDYFINRTIEQRIRYSYDANAPVRDFA